MTAPDPDIAAALERLLDAQAEHDPAEPDQLDADRYRWGTR